MLIKNKKDEMPMQQNASGSIPNDLTIKLQHTMCSGGCPEYSVSILGNGRVTFEGKRYVFAKGKHKVHIPSRSVKLLLDEFYRRGFFSLKGRYDPIVNGGFMIKLSISINGKNKEVSNFYPSQAPECLYELENTIGEIIGLKQWILDGSGNPVLEP